FVCRDSWDEQIPRGVTRIVGMLRSAPASVTLWRYARKGRRRRHYCEMCKGISFFVSIDYAPGHIPTCFVEIEPKAGKRRQYTCNDRISGWQRSEECGRNRLRQHWGKRWVD